MSTATVQKGHPKGLYPLFFTEMWERLGFYLMVGILFLYITDTERGGLGFDLKTAGEIYGTYMAFVYFTPFVGGMIADRLLGYRKVRPPRRAAAGCGLLRPGCAQHALLLRRPGSALPG
jgi:POT family proton-dependent oligopeptide transporter